MAKLGKFERWILEHTYKKTVEEHPHWEWRFLPGYVWKLDDEDEDHKALRKRQYRHLFKGEVFLNYPDFGKVKRPTDSESEIKISTREHDWEHVDRAERFKDNKAYRSAHAQYSRGKKRLLDADLIEVDGNGKPWEGIRLTTKGEMVAGELVGDGTGQVVSP